jgi:hypothetical protein
MRSAGANQAISSASRCVAAASAHTMATNRACDAASVPSWAIASASADPTSGGTEALRPASGGAGSNLGSAAGREAGGEETTGGTIEDNSEGRRRAQKRELYGVERMESPGDHALDEAAKSATRSLTTGDSSALLWTNAHCNSATAVTFIGNHCLSLRRSSHPLRLLRGHTGRRSARCRLRRRNRRTAPRSSPGDPRRHFPGGAAFSTG